MALVYNPFRDGGSGASSASSSAPTRRTVCLLLSERLRSAFRRDISIRHSKRYSGGSQVHALPG